MSTAVDEIRKICAQALMPEDRVEQVIVAVSDFQFADLQLAAAQALADAWRADKAREAATT